MKPIRGDKVAVYMIDDAGLFPPDQNSMEITWPKMDYSPYKPLDFDAFEKNMRALHNDLESEHKPINFGNTRIVDELVQGKDFWKMEIVNGRDWKMEKKLRALGISPSFVHGDIPTGRSRRIMRAANKRKRQARARTGRK